MAAAIVLREATDLPNVMIRIQTAGADHKVRPCVGAVDGKERVVEIEQSQSHSSGILPAWARSQSLSSGTVRARPCCNA